MNELNGTRALLGTSLRRDKLLLPICVATFAGVAGSSAAATAGCIRTLMPLPSQLSYSMPRPPSLDCMAASTTRRRSGPSD
jgi:hypothetical protein